MYEYMITLFVAEVFVVRAEVFVVRGKQALAESAENCGRAMPLNPPASTEDD